MSPSALTVNMYCPSLTSGSRRDSFSDRAHVLVSVMALIITERLGGSPHSSGRRAPGQDWIEGRAREAALEIREAPDAGAGIEVEEIRALGFDVDHGVGIIWDSGPSRSPYPRPPDE